VADSGRPCDQVGVPFVSDGLAPGIDPEDGDEAAPVGLEDDLGRLPEHLRLILAPQVDRIADPQDG